MLNYMWHKEKTEWGQVPRYYWALLRANGEGKGTVVICQFLRF